MKIDTIQPTLNIRSFYDFAKLERTKQNQLLQDKGIFLDLDSEKTTLVKLYFINGFFVEQIICRKNNIIIDVIPFKQGYKIERFIEVKGCIRSNRSLVAA